AAAAPPLPAQWRGIRTGHRCRSPTPLAAAARGASPEMRRSALANAESTPSLETGGVSVSAAWDPAFLGAANLDHSPERRSVLGGVVMRLTAVGLGQAADHNCRAR